MGLEKKIALEIYYHSTSVCESKKEKKKLLLSATEL